MTFGVWIGTRLVVMVNLTLNVWSWSSLLQGKFSCARHRSKSEKTHVQLSTCFFDILWAPEDKEGNNIMKVTWHMRNLSLEARITWPYGELSELSIKSILEVSPIPLVKCIFARYRIFGVSNVWHQSIVSAFGFRLCVGFEYVYLRHQFIRN